MLLMLTAKMDKTQYFYLYFISTPLLTKRKILTPPKQQLYKEIVFLNIGKISNVSNMPPYFV